MSQLHLTMEEQQGQQELKFIYLGKGRDLQEQPGNVYFRSFVEAFSEQYEAASKAVKRHVVTGVMRLLEMDGFQFFKVAGGGEEGTITCKNQKWKPASDKEIFLKIGHVFRSCRRSRFKFTPGGIADEATERAREHKKAIHEALEVRSRGR